MGVRLADGFSGRGEGRGAVGVPYRRRRASAAALFAAAGDRVKHPAQKTEHPKAGVARFAVRRFGRRLGLLAQGDIHGLAGQAHGLGFIIGQAASESPQRGLERQDFLTQIF